MSVKVRKVGNSYTLTIPAPLVEQLHLHDGQDLDVDYQHHQLIYVVPRKEPKTILWDRYASPNANIRDDLTPDQYVRSLRDDDRE